MILHEPSRMPGMEFFLNPPREVYTRYDTSHSIEPKLPDLHRYNVSPPPLRELAARSASRAPGGPGNAQGRSGMSRGGGGGSTSASEKLRQTTARFDEYNAQKSDASEDGKKGGGLENPAPRADNTDDDELIVPSTVNPAAVNKEGGATRDTVHWGQLSGTIKAEQMLLTVYMPDRRPLEVRVEATAMAGDVVTAALAAHKKMSLLRRASLKATTTTTTNSGEGGGGAEGSGEAASKSGVDYDRPELYCLMMHDGDGVPDDMAVPGDRTMQELNETEVVVMPKAFRSPGEDDEDDDAAYSTRTKRDNNRRGDNNNGGGGDDDDDSDADSVDSDFGTKPEMGGRQQNSKKAPPPPMMVPLTDGGGGGVDEDIDSDEELMMQQQAARRAAGGGAGGGGGGEQAKPPQERNRTFSTTPFSQMGAKDDDDDGGFFEAYDDGYSEEGGMMVDGITRRNTTTARAEVVSVRLPDESECKVKLGEGWRPADLIAEMALKRRHRIAIHSREYELHIMWLDQDRLHWPSTVIGPTVDLLKLVARLQDPEFELKPKEFLDKPKIKMPGTRKHDNDAMLSKHAGGNNNAGGETLMETNPRMFNAAIGGSSSSSMLGGASGSDLGGGSEGGGASGLKSAKAVYELMYVVQTAEMLEEWEIIKTNRWGRQQKRVIGIGKDTYDGEYKVYNKKRDDVNKSRFTDSVARDFRLLRNVVRVRQLLEEGKPRFFTITYRDSVDGEGTGAAAAGGGGGSGSSGGKDDKEQEQVYEVPLSANAPKSSSAKGRALDAEAAAAKTLSRGDSESFGGGNGFAGMGSGAGGNGGSGGSSGRVAELAEQEKQASEKCLRIVAKMLFLIDLQRQRSERATRRRGSSGPSDDKDLSGGGGGLRVSMQNTAGALLGGASRGKAGKGKLGYIAEGSDGKA